MVSHWLTYRWTLENSIVAGREQIVPMIIRGETVRGYISAEMWIVSVSLYGI
jgi:hypothetical protein